MSVATLWLYLHFPALQLDSQYQNTHSRGYTAHADTGLNKEQNAQSDTPAFVVIQGRRNEVLQLNQQAANQGITLGMGLGTAASLCQDLQVQDYTVEIEEQALLEIAHWLYLYTADISLSGANGLLLRVSNMLTLYDNLENYWRSIQQHLDKLGLRYHAACAYSPLAAELLAKAGKQLITDNREQIRKALHSQTLYHSRLKPKQLEKLQRVGIRSMKQLIDTPMAALAKRFDLELVNYVGRLTGSLPHPINFYHPPRQFARDLELLYELSNLDNLDKPLLRLLLQLEHFLRIQDHYAYELQLTLHLRDKSQHEVCATSAKGDYQAEVWLALFRLRFESIRLKSPVLSLNLQALRTQARHEESLDLFSGRQAHTSSLELISTLQAKLGKEAVQGLKIVDDPRPELSTALHSAGKLKATKSESTAHMTPDKLRPSILLPKPELLRERVTLIEGPERIATGWWDEQAVVRDYFIARSHRGSWLWVFKTPEQYWYLHGVFS